MINMYHMYTYVSIPHITSSRAVHDIQKMYNRYNYNYTLFLIIDTTKITLKKS